jgi:hypothetical protein
MRSGVRRLSGVDLLGFKRPICFWVAHDVFTLLMT